MRPCLRDVGLNAGLNGGRRSRDLGPDKTATYAANDLHDNVGYNPWEGRQIKGWPEQVMLRGQMLVDGGTFLGTPGSGQWINRPELTVSHLSKPEA